MTSACTSRPSTRRLLATLVAAMVMFATPSFGQDAVVNNESEFNAAFNVIRTGTTGSGTITNASGGTIETSSLRLINRALTLKGSFAVDTLTIVRDSRLTVEDFLEARNTGFLNIVRSEIGGNGTIDSSRFALSVNSGGRVAPGSNRDNDEGIGQLEIDGDVTLGAGSVLEIQFGKDNAIDRLDVQGTVVVDDEAGVEFIQEAAGVTTDNPLTFLTATDGIRGFTPSPPSFSNTVLIDGTGLKQPVISIDPGGFGSSGSAAVTFESLPSFAEDARTSGGARVGSILDGLADTDAANIKASVDAVRASGNNAASLDSLTNVIANAAAFNAGLAQGQVAQAASARVSGLDTVAANLNKPTQVAAADVPDGTIDSAAYTLPEVPDTTAPSLWVQAVGGFGSIDTDSQGLGSDATSYGVSLGVEWGLNPDATVGVFGGYTQTNTEIDGVNDESDVDNLQLGVYGRQRFDRRWHANATVSGSYLNFETSRVTGSGTAEGDFDGWGVYATAEVLYDIAVNGNTVFSPLVGAEFNHVERNGYTESGAGALNLTAQDSDNTYFTSLLGGQLATTFVTGEGANAGLGWTVAARAAWGHQFGDDSASTTSSFTAAPASAFNTSGPARNRDSLRTGISLELAPAVDQSWSAFARYEVNLTNGAEDHVVRAGVRFAF